MRLTRPLLDRLARRGTPRRRLARAGLPLVSLVLASLALAGCGDCDCEQHRAEGAAKATAQAPAAAPAPSPSAAGPAAGAAAGAAAEPTPPVVATRWRGEGATLEFSAWRMRCAGCEKKVEDTLKALPGVTDALATHADSKVVVTLAEPGLRASLPAQIAAALAAQGFEVLGK